MLTSYLVSNAVVLPISAWLSDRFGRKRFYMVCVLLFTTSSLLCGLSTSLPMLIFFRVLQGAGGGGLAPSEQAILADTFAPKKRGMAFAMYGMAVVLAPAIGPTLGGYITDNFSWHWIFFINVPFGILSLYLTSRIVVDPPHLQEGKQKARRSPVDYMGLGLIVVGLGCLQIVLDKGEREDWFASNFIVVFSVITLVALAFFVWWEWRERHPILNLRLLKNKNFAISNLLMFVLGATLYGTTILIPQFLQTLMGYTAQLAGMALSPGGLTIMAMMPIVGFLVSRVDPRYMIVAGFAGSALALFQMTSLYLGTDFKTAMFYRICQSISLAFLFIPINTISYADVPRSENNQISAMINLMRNVGGSVGISMVTTLIARRAQVHQQNLIGHISAGNPQLRSMLGGMSSQFARRSADHAHTLNQAYGQIYGLVRQQATVLAYKDTIWLLAIAMLASVPLALLARRPKPSQVQMGH